MLWVTVVYFPMAHMVWGKGGLLNASWAGASRRSTSRAARSSTSPPGVSALVCAFYLGKRMGYPKTMMPRTASCSASSARACCGSAGSDSTPGARSRQARLATSAFVATHFAAAAGTLGWVAAEWIRHGKPSVLGAISGAVCGLVGITPASGFVTPMSSLVIGFVAGVVCYLMVTVVKKRFGYDDSLDAFGVHGTGGTLGAILTGVFATSAVNPVFKDAAGSPLPVGLVDGNGSQILNQLAGVGLTVALAVIGTLILLKVVDLVVGLRVSEEDEIQGLDLSQHGEDGYNLDLDLTPVRTAGKVTPSSLVTNAKVLTEQL